MQNGVNDDYCEIPFLNGMLTWAQLSNTDIMFNVYKDLESLNDSYTLVTGKNIKNFIIQKNISLGNTIFLNNLPAELNVLLRINNRLDLAIKQLYHKENKK